MVAIIDFLVMCVALRDYSGVWGWFFCFIFLRMGSDDEARERVHVYIFIFSNHVSSYSKIQNSSAIPSRRIY